MAGVSVIAPAMAANTTASYDLKNYPAPFVDDGNTNFLIVVGQEANPSDIVGAINVAVRLGAERVETKSVNTGGSQSISEGIDLSLPGDLIYLKDSFSKDTLTKSDMPTVLADDTFTDDSGTNYDYTQSVVLGTAATFDYVRYDSDKDPELVLDMSSTSSSSPLYTLKVTFSKTVNMSALDSKAQTLNLFGTEYTVSSDTDSDTLVLFGSSNSVTMNKDETKSVTVGGKTYDVTVIGFDTSNDKVVLKVGTDTKSIAEGTSKKVGGLEIYAQTVTSWDNGNKGLVVLQLGSQKLTFEDGQAVQTGDDSTDIDGTQVSISSSVGALSTLQVKVYKPNSDDDYIKSGASFTDPVFGAFKISLAGVSPALTDSSRDTLKFRTSGDKKAYVTAKDMNGNEANVYFGYLEATSDTRLEDDDQKQIAVVENTTVAKDEFSFLAPADAKYTHMVKVKKIYQSATKGYAEFTDVFSGATYQTVEGEFNSAGDVLDLTVDGKTYKVTMMDATSGSETVRVYYNDAKLVIFPVMEMKNGEQIAFTQDVTIATNANVAIVLPGSTTALTLTDYFTIGNASVEGKKTALAGKVRYILDETTATNATYSTVTISVDGGQDADTDDGLNDAAVVVVEEKDEANDQNAIVFLTVDDATDGNYIGYADPLFTTSTKTGPVATEDDKVNHYVDYYGTFVVKDTSDSDHTIMTAYYPDHQMYALVGAGSTISVGGAAGSVTYNQSVPIVDNIARVDTEVTEAQKQANNLILVGGPCVNRLTAQAMGLNYPTCGTDSKIPQNAAMIKLVNGAFKEGMAALVVAGWDAENTRAACSVLQQYGAYSGLTGTGVEVDGTTNPTLKALTE